MDSMPPQPPQQPEGGQPPSQPYTPPQSGYAPYTPPPSQAPMPPAYQAYTPPPEQQPLQPYGQGMPPPAPARRGGFPWLACCGITCLVLIILGGGMTFCTYQMVKPFMNMGMEIAKISDEVKKADIAMIRQQASPVTVEQLVANAALYEGKWVAVEGTVTSNTSGSSSNFSAGDFSTEDSTNYTLTNNVVVMDVTKSPPVASPGQKIRAYGKFYIWDLASISQMPFVGPALEQEMKKDPQFAQTSKIIMVIAKQVELASGSFPGAPQGKPPAEEQPAQEPPSPMEERSNSWGN